jgi:uncharacterized protein YndB with AHSA1/START domain
MDRTGSARTSFNTPSDCELEIQRLVEGSRRAIFGAWTDARLVPQWMLGPEGWSMPVCEIDLRVGGSWHFLWRRQDGAQRETTGRYREILPPNRLVTTESWGEGWPETVNTLRLAEAEGGTAVSIRIVYPSREARERAEATGMKEGLEASFERLEQLLKSRG